MKKKGALTNEYKEISKSQNCEKKCKMKMALRAKQVCSTTKKPLWKESVKKPYTKMASAKFLSML